MIFSKKATHISDGAIRFERRDKRALFLWIRSFGDEICIKSVCFAITIKVEVAGEQNIIKTNFLTVPRVDEPESIRSGR
jgi:hypothetical protein